MRRFLYASTCSVYGAAGGDDLVAEDAPLRPVTPYAESKVRVEDDLPRSPTTTSRPVFLRNATAFGFSPRLRADIVLNNLVGHALLTGEVRVLSDGTPVAAARARRGHRGRVLGRARRAARGRARPGVQRRHRDEQPHGRRDRRRRSSRRCPAPKLVITGETGADPRSYRVDFSRIRARAARLRAREWTVKEGALELADAYRRARADPGGLRAALHPARRGCRDRRPTRHRRRHALRWRSMTAAGEEMHALVERLYPLCRSITGDGVRRDPGRSSASTSRCDVHEVPTGTQVLDWTVPKEWNIRDAYIADAAGRRVVDFAESNLHVVGYSVPVRRPMPLDELRAHLHTLPDQPDLDPLPHQLLQARTGASACAQRARWTRCRTASTRWSIDSTLGRRRPHLRASTSCPGEIDRGGDRSPATSAIRRWPTTTWPASRWPPSWPGSWRALPAAATPTASSSRPARSASITWLARNAGRVDRGPARAGAGLRWATGGR